MPYRTGANLVANFKYPFQHFNRMKNHWRQSGVVAAMVDAQPGMIGSDSDDDKLYHFTGLSPGSDEILQANFSYNTDVRFNEIIAHGDTKSEAYIRRDTILWMDCFDHGVLAFKYGWTWDITSLNTQGAGTNTIDTTPSHITLTTDNNAIGDNEGTRSDFAIILRSRKNRSEIMVELGQTANTQFYFGWNVSGVNALGAGDEYVIVFYDSVIGPNWQIAVNDGGGEEVYDSGVAADTDEIRLEIWVETDGTVHFAIDGVEHDITGSITNLMTASAHYLIVGQVQSVGAALARVAEMDYVINEKFKVH